MKSITFPSLKRIALFTAVLIAMSSCKKAWVEPVLYTVNLSLARTPDSVDANSVYYYADGMKLQLHLTITSNGSTVKDEVWTHEKNYHWEDNIDGVNIIGEVVSLSNDTSLHIEDYPVVMRVYKDYKVLYEEVEVENSYSY